MKTKIFVLLLLFIGTSTFAQKLIDTKKVPSEVQRSFKRKASKAKEIKWFQVSKQIYLVKYKMGEWPAEAEFNREGTMLSLKQEIDPAKLPGKIQNELRQKHRDKKVFKAFNITKGRKDKYYSIILHKKQGRKKPPLVYEAQYSLAGKFITLWEPEVKNPQQATGPVRKRNLMRMWKRMWMNSRNGFAMRKSPERIFHQLLENTWMIILIMNIKPRMF
jgi:hypothetical protein